MSVKDMIKKEAAASEKAEAEWNKAHEARLNKPTPPFKPQKQQPQHQWQQKDAKGNRKRKRPRGRGRPRGGGRQQPKPRVRLNPKSLALQNPAQGNTIKPFVKQPLAQKVCYGCGLTGHIKANCPANP
jgi:hypothetical protein